MEFYLLTLLFMASILDTVLQLGHSKWGTIAASTEVIGGVNLCMSVHIHTLYQISQYLAVSEKDLTPISFSKSLRKVVKAVAV